MTYALVPIQEGSGPTISLQRPVLLVGRHPECDVRIHIAKISRRHCCLAVAYNRILIKDLGSRNGVRVNGKEIEEAQLTEGDEIAIGPLIYRLVPEATAAAPQRPSSPASPNARGANPRSPATPPDVNDADIDLIPLDESR